MVERGEKKLEITIIEAALKHTPEVMLKSDRTPSTTVTNLATSSEVLWRIYTFHQPVLECNVRLTASPAGYSPFEVLPGHIALLCRAWAWWRNSRTLCARQRRWW